MTALQVFEFEDQQRQVRVRADEYGMVWFVAVDVCRVLAIRNSRDALSRLDDDEKGVVSTDTLGGNQTLAAVNEAGLYSLILSSRKPEARAFKRWITHEVLPAIARQGWYVTPAAAPQIQVPENYLDQVQTDYVRLFKENEQLQLRLRRIEQSIKAIEAEHELGVSTKEWMSINGHRVQNGLPLLDTFQLAKASQRAAALSRQHNYGTVRAQRGGLLGANTLYHVAVLNTLIAEDFDQEG